MSDPDAAAAAAAATLTKVIAAVQVYIGATSAVLVWDWLSCLPQEWQYIWKADWSLMKVLYIIVRYYTFAVLIVTDSWFFLDWSEASCSKHLRILPGVAVVIDLAVEGVLALRVFALYGRDKKIGALLAVLLLAFLGVMIAVPVLAFDYIRLPSWPGPCVVTGKPSIAGPKFIIAFYASPMAFDTIVTGLTVYKILERMRSGAKTTLLQFLLRDGLFYFFAITTLNLINVIFFVQPNAFIQSVNAPMSIQLSSVLSCRLILNLRSKVSTKTGVKQFSSSRGRWVTEVAPQTVDGGATANYPMQPVRRTPGAVSQFGADPKASSGPLAFSNITPVADPQSQSNGLPVVGTNVDPRSPPGIVVRWEQETVAEWDQKDTDAESMSHDSRRREDVSKV